jgi:hypothetical protein|tara:strand:+ start:131 stop:382 length:252 start_codon:yes stop_codon:yes gene_type:complete
MKITKEHLKKIVQEELGKVSEMDLFGKKKADAAGYDRAMKTRHEELADIHNRLKAALGDPNQLQQAASEIVKNLALKFRTMDR